MRFSDDPPNSNDDLYINEKGQIRVSRGEQGALVRHLFDWIDAPSIRPVTEWNTIRLEVIGDTLRVFANGQFVSEGTDRRLVPSKIHVYLFPKQVPFEARFRSIRVWKL